MVGQSEREELLVELVKRELLAPWPTGRPEVPDSFF